jgi:integrase
MPIYATITLNGERATFTTGKYIQPAQWDAIKQRARGTSDASQAINNHLLQVRNKIYQKELELMNRGYIINANTLKDAYLERVEAIQGKTLCQIFEEYLVDARKAIDIEVKKDTVYSYERTYDLLKDYMKLKYKRTDFALQELNRDFIEKFNLYLRSDLKHKKNTAVKHLRCLIRVVNVAVANRHLTFDPFLNFKAQREICERVFLTEEELRTLINKDFQIKRLERVRDLFVFCCFTGLSYSDVKTLAPEHFETDSNGRTWIKKKRVKTGVLFRVPLLPIPKLILEKYKGGDKLLPVVDLSSTDAYLKEIAELCGINKNISSHTARFTFATTVTITNRISLEVVSKMMGHTNTRMTSHYAKIIDKYIGEEMDKLNELYYTK